MDEIFAEYIVKCKLSGKMLAARLGLIFGSVVLSVMALLLLKLIAPIAICIVIYAAVYLWGLTKVEYEYSILNGDMTIEAIYGQKSRRKKEEIDIKKAENIALLSSGLFAQYNGRTIVKDYSSHTKNDDLVGIVYHEKDSYIQVIIQPNERVLDAIKAVRPSFARNLTK